MKFILFGSRGMLGTYVKKILSIEHNVICIDRNEFDIEKDSWKKLKHILVNLFPFNVIINCAGIIPQKIDFNNYNKYIRINTLFPHKLFEISNSLNIKMIHITTDCVFNGKKGNYSELDDHTETNIYGITKSLGELDSACVIRTSILGEEKNGKKSLLEWIKSKKNQSIDGFINHYWNGVTCLMLANIIKLIIENKLFWTGVRHIYSPNIISKYEICEIVNRIYNLTINIVKKETEKIDKTLTSIYCIESIKNIIPSIEEQIKIQANFDL